MTVGSAFGSIRDLFAKVKAIDAKHGKFDLLICVGDFFGPPRIDEQVSEENDDISQLLDGRLEGMPMSLHNVYHTHHGIKHQSNAMLCKESVHCQPLLSRSLQKLVENCARMSFL